MGHWSLYSQATVLNHSNLYDSWPLPDWWAVCAVSVHHQGRETLGHIKVSHLSLQTTSGLSLADHVPACAHYVCVQKHIKPSLSEPVHCIALYQIHCSRRSFDPRSLSEPFIQLGIIPNTLWPGPLQDSLQQSEREREVFWMPRECERRVNNTESGPFLSLLPPLWLEDHCLMRSWLADAAEVMNGRGSLEKTGAWI